MGYWYHPELEKNTVGAVMRYERSHPQAKLRLVLNGEEEYICTVFAFYESENSGDLDITEDDPQYDEFYEIAFRIVDIIHSEDEILQKQDVFAVNYRSFPIRITDADTGEVIYPAPTNTTIPSQD